MIPLRHPWGFFFKSQQRLYVFSINTPTNYHVAFNCTYYSFSRENLTQAYHKNTTTRIVNKENGLTHYFTIMDSDIMDTCSRRFFRVALGHILLWGLSSPCQTHTYWLAFFDWPLFNRKIHMHQHWVKTLNIEVHFISSTMRQILQRNQVQSLLASNNTFRVKSKMHPSLMQKNIHISEPNIHC